jgi:DNA invertase Pin-like site-specific DNA recombinase
MTMIGYARVSTNDQHPEAQEERLKAAGCTRIYTDHGASGAKASRPGWDKCLDRLESGDTLVAVRLDRIGRSVRNLLQVADDLEKRGANLVLIDQGIDTRTPMGRMLFTILGAIAQFERDLIIERTNDGLAATTARGRNGGRPARLNDDHTDLARRWRSEGVSVKEIGARLGRMTKDGNPVSRQTVYRALGMTE